VKAATGTCESGIVLSLPCTGVYKYVIMERLSRSLWQGFRQSPVLLFLSHVAQHETSLLVSEGNSDLPWGPVSVPSSAVFVKGACIFLGNEQCLTVDVF